MSDGDDAHDGAGPNQGAAEALGERVTQLLWMVLDAVPADLMAWSIGLLRLLHAADTFPRGEWLTVPVAWVWKRVLGLSRGLSPSPANPHPRTLLLPPTNPHPHPHPHSLTPGVQVGSTTATMRVKLRCATRSAGCPCWPGAATLPLQLQRLHLGPRLPWQQPHWATHPRSKGAEPWCRLWTLPWRGCTTGCGRTRMQRTACIWSGR